MTPLIMNATQSDDCAEATVLLIAAGADLTAADARGKTALAHATERGLSRIIEVLRRHGAAYPRQCSGPAGTGGGFSGALRGDCGAVGAELSRRRRLDSTSTSI